MALYPHLFSPIQLGNLELPNRIVHVPTDISSSHADGEVSERDIHHHADIARGGTGFIIVGATTPDMATGRPTVTCLVADGDNYIPGLARLAEGMHRYGAKCAVQLQHPGRQCAIPRYNTLGATDRVLKLPWSAGHEIVYENAEEKGKEIRAASIAEILELVDLFSEAAWRVKQAGFDAVELHAAHGYLLSEFMSPFLNMRTDRFGGTFENRMRFPLAVIDSIQKKCGRGFPVLVRYSFDEWCEGGRGARGGRRDRPGPRAGRLRRGRPVDGDAGEPGRRLRPDAVPAGLGDVRGRGGQARRPHPGDHQPLAARPRLLRADPGRGQDRPGRPRPAAPGRSVLAGQGAVRPGQADPPLHLLPGRLLAGIADGEEGDRLLDQRGVRQPGLRRDDADGRGRSASRSSAAARPAWRRPGSRPSAATS